MKTRLSKVLACLFAGILTATAADYSVFAAEETPEIKYYVCPNSKILKEDETDYSEMTANGTLLFSAAANERESAQIILTKEGEYENFTLKLEDNLKDENGNTIPKTNFEIYFEHYVKAEQFRNLSGSHTENGKVSWDIYPDALIPEKLAREVGANTFKLGGYKKNQGLWFTVTVPPGTPAGTYEGKLVGSLEIEVEVKVFDFELDTVTNSRTHFASGTSHLPAKKGKREEYVKEIIGIKPVDETAEKPIAEIKYLDGSISVEGKEYDLDSSELLYRMVIDNLINKRKVSSGFNYGTFWGVDTLEDDIQRLTKHIRSADSITPYYDLYTGYIDYTTESGQKTIRINRYPSNANGIGLEMVMKRLVDQSITDQFDYLQYAYVRIPQDDEPDVTSKDAIVRTLVNSYILEDTKDTVKNYIKSKNGIDTGLKNELDASVSNIPYLHTVALTEDSGKWSDILYQGVSAAPVEGDLKGKFSIEETYDYYDVEKKQMQQYTVTIKANSDNDFRMNSFCPQFNDFSASENVKHTPYTLLSENLTTYQKGGTDQNDGTVFWWYSTFCSGKSASTAGYMINENHGTNTADTGASALSMDSLAVARANKWQQFNLGILGELYWGVDAFYFKYDPNNRNVHDKYSIPRASHYSYEVEDRDKDLICGHKYLKTDIGITATNGDDYTAGDGMLIYPVKQLLKNVYGITDESKLDSMAAKYGYFLSSIRLENIGEANDDYDYLCFAEQLVNSKPDYPEYRNRLNSIIQMVIEPGNVDYTDPELTNPSNLTRARNMLAALIEGRFGNIKEVTNDGVNNKFTAATDGVPIVKKWHTSNQVLCFDVCETDTYQNSNGSRCVTIFLESYDEQQQKRLNEPIDINFATKKIDKCEGATLVHKGAGWYTVQIPLNKVPLNTSGSKPANGDETLSAVNFDKRYVYRSFLVDNFRILKEVTNDGRNNTFTSTTDGVPVINKWKYSNKALCFDVCETDTYQNSNGVRQASISLMTSEWHRLNKLMTIDFEKKTISNCKGAVLVPKGNGWYTVQIPLNNVELNLSTNEAKGPANGNETFSMVHFMKDYVYRSFLVDNFRILKEVTNDGRNNTFTSTTDGVPVINKWKYSNLALCFDVCETDTYQNSNGVRQASISLMTSDWHRLNQLMAIDFEKKTISNCKGAVLVPKGNGWYTVQIPLNNVELNLSTNEAKGPANGNETFSMVHFMKGYVYRSFLVDNFKLETAIGNGDLNGDGKSDTTDATTSLNYLARNGAPPQNVWEADLDHNGVLNAVDLTLLKRMQLTQ